MCAVYTHTETHKSIDKSIHPLPNIHHIFWAKIPSPEHAETQQAGNGRAS